MSRYGWSPRFQTLSVAELRELLEDRAEDELVIFTTDFGDHCHTAQALPLKGELEEVAIAESAYSNSGYMLSDDDEDACESCGGKSNATGEACDECGGPDPDAPEAVKRKYLLIR